MCLQGRISDIVGLQDLRWEHLAFLSHGALELLANRLFAVIGMRQQALSHYHQAKECIAAQVH